MVESSIPINGFLGTDATFAADNNLVVQLAMGATLIVGLILAKHKRYKAHGACQTTVLLSKRWLIGFEMWPSVRQQVAAHLPKSSPQQVLRDRNDPRCFGFSGGTRGTLHRPCGGHEPRSSTAALQRRKRWVRIDLLLCSVALIGGLGTYYAWYIAPFH